mmetsp:Transcript_1526/g.4824  ORF Transcript_1526/g.4824 Transcript_1526/m.4824 type:complete len:221 (-) Transcript_1526:71-733(-)
MGLTFSSSDANISHNKSSSFRTSRCESYITTSCPNSYSTTRRKTPHDASRGIEQNGNSKPALDLASQCGRSVTCNIAGGTTSTVTRSSSIISTRSASDAPTSPFRAAVSIFGVSVASVFALRACADAVRNTCTPPYPKISNKTPNARASSAASTSSALAPRKAFATTASNASSRANRFMPSPSYASPHVEQFESLSHIRAHASHTRCSHVRGRYARRTVP